MRRFCTLTGGSFSLLFSLMAGSQACGQVLDSTWGLEWAEEFNQPTDTVQLASRWRFDYPWGRSLGQYESQYYLGQGVQATGKGVLNLVTQRLEAPLTYRGKVLNYSSGMLMSRNTGDSFIPEGCSSEGVGFSYGMFEMRCRMPRDPNSWPAFWLFGMPDEVDVFEASTHGFSNTVHQINHIYYRPSLARTRACSCYFTNYTTHTRPNQAFHTYGLKWLPGQLTFYYEGWPIRRETLYTPSGCPMALITNLAVWAWSQAQTDTLAVDYLRVYRPRQGPEPIAQRFIPLQATTDLNWVPYAEFPRRIEPVSRQTWRFLPDSNAAHPPRFLLFDNLNPPCNAQFSLPTATESGWSPPLIIWPDEPMMVRVTLPVGASAVWTLYDACNRPIESGLLHPGNTEQSSWPRWAPGAYTLVLGCRGQLLRHPVRVLGRPAKSQPDAAWLQPTH